VFGGYINNKPTISLLPMKRVSEREKKNQNK